MADPGKCLLVTGSPVDLVERIGEDPSAEALLLNSSFQDSSCPHLKVKAAKRESVVHTILHIPIMGEDTRTNFTDHLYHALVGKEIKTFIDRHLPKGEEISQTLLKAFEESRISLVILSKNYADSRWCLEELVKIHQCKESKQQIVLPVFYKVDPSHLRNQTGCYGAAFIDHERKFEDKEMVRRWRRALTKVANLSGYHVKEEDYEATIISNIVNDILVRVADGTYLKGSHIKRYSKERKKILALRSNNNNNLFEPVQPSEQAVKREYAKFQMEPADSGYGALVHIKCCYNNKYLRRANDHQYWIVAGANEQVEDKKHWSCTLFKRVVVHSDNKAVVRLLHVQLGHFVTSFTANDFNQCLYAGSNTPNLHDDLDVYTVVDLEPLVLPKSFALKSNNNKKYLRYIHQRIENFDELVQLSEEDVKSEYAKFQMLPENGGYGYMFPKFHYAIPEPQIEPADGGYGCSDSKFSLEDLV